MVEIKYFAKLGYTFLDSRTDWEHCGHGFFLEILLNFTVVADLVSVISVTISVEITAKPLFAASEQMPMRTAMSHVDSTLGEPSRF